MGFRDWAPSLRMGTSEPRAVVGGGHSGTADPGLALLSLRCPSSLGEVLALALRAFLELMEHGVVSWETLSIPFVRKVGGLFSGKQVGVVERCQGLAFHGDEVVTTSAPPKVVCYVNMNLMDASVQPLALGLLENVTLSSPNLGQLVKSEVPLDRLLVHLQV